MLQEKLNCELIIIDTNYDDAYAFSFCFNNEIYLKNYWKIVRVILSKVSRNF